MLCIQLLFLFFLLFLGLDNGNVVPRFRFQLHFGCPWVLHREVDNPHGFWRVFKQVFSLSALGVCFLFNMGSSADGTLNSMLRSAFFIILWFLHSAYTLNKLNRYVPNILTVCLNKYIFQYLGFTFPLTLTGDHMCSVYLHSTADSHSHAFLWFGCCHCFALNWKPAPD